MKIVAGADWRDTIPFERPVLVADLAPGDDARCALCPAVAPALPRTALWAVKHRHPQNSAGYVRFYCAEHRPAPPAPAPVAAAAAKKTTTRARTATPRTSAPRRAAAPEREAVMCPDCFVAVPPSGICGMCGQPVG